MSLPGRLIELPWGRVFVHEHPGPPCAQALPKLLLLHGYMQSHYAFLPVVEGLSQARPLVLIDLPGHGESDRPSPLRFAYDLPSLAESVRQVLDALSLDRVAVLGHSLGGAVAVTLAARHPERCQRLVLVSPALWPPELPLSARLALLPIVGPILFKEGFGKSDLRRLFVRRIYKDPEAVTKDKVDYYWERMNRAGGKEALHACLQASAAWPLHNPDIDRVRAQVLLVFGEEDRLTPLWRGKQLLSDFPGAQLAVIPASGHNPFEERPREFCRTVVPFLSEGQ